MAGVDADAETYHQPPPDDFDEDPTEYTQHGQKILFKPNPGPQEEFLAATEREVLFGGAAGGGKAQPLYSYVYTPSGPVRMGDVEVGLIVSTPKGGTAKVIQTHPQGVQKIFRVTFQDGSFTDCTGDHLWLSKPVREGENRWKTRTTLELLESPRKFVVPLGFWDTDGIQADVPIDPYVLGALLGDGSLTTNSIGLTTADQEIIDNFESAGMAVTKRKGKYQYGVLGLVPDLKRLGVLYTSSYDKSIPDIYLKGSYSQRQSLLQGLMDTDGYVSADGKVNFTSMSNKLREQVAYLVRSLGGTAKEFKGHSLYIRHPDSSSLFRLSRKKKRCHKKNINNRIVSIQPIGVCEAKCITLDDTENLYLTDNFVVTHNSFAMLADPMRSFDIPQFSGLLLRRTTEELRELIWKSQELYSEVFLEDMKFGARSNAWVHKNGGRLWMTYLDRDEDVLRYQGQAYNWIGFDELTQWSSPFPWNYLRSRLRTTTRRLPLYMRASSNPGNVGGWWVRKMFIDPAPPGTPFWATDIETGEVLRYPELDHHKQPHRFAGQPLFQRRFIPSTLKDNPYLYSTGEYEANLLALPEIQRKQLLEGSWDVVEGAAFPEFSRPIHVIKPYPLPDSWLKFRGCDYGYTSFSGVVWCCLHPSGQIIVYRDLEVSKVTAYDLVDLIANIEKNDNVSYGVLDWSVFRAMGDRGKSLEQDFHRHRMRWRKADRSKGSRVAGKNEIHRRLQTINEITGEPELVFFENATNCIQQIPIIPLDRNNPDDVDTNSRDHVYDALRYAVTSRPNPGKNPVYLDYAMSRRTISNPYAVQREPSDPVFGY